MFATVALIALFVISLVAFAVGAITNDDEVKPFARIAGVVFLVIGLIVAVFTCATTVDGKSIGVKVAMGKPSGTLDPGFKLKAPWEKVEIMDGTKQTNRFEDDSKITAKIADGVDAKVNTNFRWRLELDAAEKMYTDYRSFDNMKDNLVIPMFKTTVNEVLAGYDPLAEARNGNADSDRTLTVLSDKIKKSMQGKLGKDILIDEVNIQFIELGDKTQGRIDALNTEKANTEIAAQKQETARREAEANRIAESSLSENVLINNCLKIAEENNKDLLGCIPGAAGSPIVNRG